MLDIDQEESNDRGSKNAEIDNTATENSTGGIAETGENSGMGFSEICGMIGCCLGAIFLRLFLSITMLI